MNFAGFYFVRGFDKLSLTKTVILSLSKDSLSLTKDTLSLSKETSMKLIT
jgi:hypothetical protein